MLSEKREGWSKQTRRHRNVYRFGGPWARSLLSSIPWINALILVVMLLAVHGRMLISPGVVFDLPRAPLREGLHAELMALMIPVARDTPGGEETLIFFDDDRYSTLDEDQMAVLSERLRNRLSLSAHRELLLMADKRVPHGDVIRFVNIAREAGVQRVNVAEKPE
ncbi:MAG TPA: biopolymer transporter ExbD [Kiritimatiellia bacterium]|nr:biopolymer transporter ExbD [Kiritimatiellia bacterium]HPS05965.1 biopolymer transporter ExbD [Kiritimatiellia bacterium]